MRIIGVKVSQELLPPLSFLIKSSSVIGGNRNIKKHLSSDWNNKENNLDASNQIKIKPVKVCIEGNIGSGKTTLLEYFKKHNHVEVIPEPVSEWQSVGNGNTLGLFYEDPSRWSYLFQSYVLYTMLKVHKQKQTSPVMLMERSVYSAGYCFVENLHKSGMMTSVEHSVYRKWFDCMVEQEQPAVDLIVYLRTTPEECYERIKKRSREEESDIPMSLITSIHQRYEDWLITKAKFHVPAPVLVLDGNKDLKDMFKIYETNASNILLGMGDLVITCAE